MAAGGGSQQTMRRAIGALKDSTKVGLAKVNSENKDLDVAIIKATKHDETLAKEKHLMTILNALSASSPRASVSYCIQGLIKRLAKTHNWTVALKSLTVLHRALKEVDHTFPEELINYSNGRRFMLNLSHFRDDSSPNAWEYSAWIRAYALYLEEHLECFCVLKYDVQKNPSNMKELDTSDLLEQLPAIQQLLFRLLDCKPEGMAIRNSLIHCALSIVAGDSVKLYVAITDGILNMIDKYFEMERNDAIRALEIYKKAVSQGEKLSEFFEICRNLEFGQRINFIKIEKPPASFLSAMEQYAEEAPHVLALEWIQINDGEDDTPIQVPPPQTVLSIEDKQHYDDQEKTNSCPTSLDSSVATSFLSDLLCLDDELTQEASTSERKRSLAFAAVTSDNPLTCETRINSTSQIASWELALVTAPSSNGAPVAESKLGDGLDRLTLDSLYNDAIARRMNPNCANQMLQKGHNPFDSFHNNQVQFCASNDVLTATNVETADLSREQSFLMMQKEKQQQQHEQQQQHQEPPMVGLESTNPSGNPFIDDNVSSSFDVENVAFHLPQDSTSGLI